MSSDLQSFLAFLEEQKSRQASHFPTLKVDKVLAFMGTTSLPGTFAACSVHTLRSIERGASTRDLRIRLAGPLPRPPARGECVTVHMTRVERYQGFQVKTRVLAAGVAETDLVESAPAGSEKGAPGQGGPTELVVKGAQIYTVHHSPYTLKFFESVPFEEVEETLVDVRYALVALGETANLSPRFIFHHEVKEGRISLFHGDGLALKTYMNIRANKCETRLVVDLDDFSGFALRGLVEEFAPHQHPEAFERICQGFQAGSWGRPSRVFRFVPEGFGRVRPIG